MGMPHASLPWTADRVRALPDDGKRYELIDGELLVTPSPSPAHQRALSALLERLLPYLRSTATGQALTSPADLAFGEDEVLQPDLFVVPQAPGRILRWSDVTSLLLVVEILSPRTARYDRLTKRRRYQRGGVPEYWIVDLDARVVERWRPDDERPEILSETLDWRPDPSRDPLTIDLGALFKEAWGE